MTLTPNLEAVALAAAEARRTHADEIARDDALGIGMRMAIETAESILGGAADMTDREIPLEQVWPQVSHALAHALTAFLMTAWQGDAARAAEFLPGALASVQEVALVRLQRGRAAFAEGVVRTQHQAGRA